MTDQVLTTVYYLLRLLFDYFWFVQIENINKGAQFTKTNKFNLKTYIKLLIWDIKIS